MKSVTESMTGRAATLHVLPFSLAATGCGALLTGGYPEALARPQARGLWFSSGIQTCVERYVRAILRVRDLSTIRRFLALLASRHGRGSGQGLSGLANRRGAPPHARKEFFVTPAAAAASGSAAR